MDTKRSTKWLMAACVLGLLTLQHLAAPAGALAETLRWTRTSGGDGGSGVAVAADGSVYVAGSPLLRKYSSTGAVLWTRTYNWNGSGVAVAADGSVYVVGSSLLRKFSSKGAVLWTKTYNGTGSGVAVAADGNVYVVGWTNVQGQGDLLLRKYSPAGVVRWTRTYNGAANGWDEGRGVAVAADGNVYVVGDTEVAGYDLLLRKYSPTGVVLWTKTYDRGDNEEGFDVAVAADGSVYVVGQTNVQGTDLLLRKYSPAGVVRWTRTYNRANGYDSGYGVAVAADGSVYVVGETNVQGQGADLLLRKYSSAGAVLWSKNYNRAASTVDIGWGVAVAADRSVYVAGETAIDDKSYTEHLLLKYK